MSIAEILLPEIKHEAESTGKMLSAIPTDKFDYTPHEKSMKLKDLATHIADLSGWIAAIVSTDYMDFAEGKAPRPEINSTADLVKYFEDNTQKSIAALSGTSDEDLAKNWVLRHGDHVILDLPKAAVIRSMAMNHVYHHRAQIGMYLRLLDEPIPGMYGPSADDRAK